jgi:hypothetical protein
LEWVPLDGIIKPDLDSLCKVCFLLIGSENGRDAISIGQCHILNQANENIFDQASGAENCGQELRLFFVINWTDHIQVRIFFIDQRPVKRGVLKPNLERIHNAN